MDTATDKQVSYLLYLIFSDPDIYKVLPNGKESRENLEHRLKNISGLDASFLISNIKDENLGGVQEYLAKLY